MTLSSKKALIKNYLNSKHMFELFTVLDGLNLSFFCSSYIRGSLRLYLNYIGKSRLLVSNFHEIIKVFKVLTRSKYLIDILGMDCLGLSCYYLNKYRFNLYVVCLNLIENRRYSISLSCRENQKVPSISEIYKGADWLEREVWDMYGIYFTGHKNLRRILTDYGFKGHPLRKDFPVIGFNEVSYNSESGSVTYTGISLQQEYRRFEILNNWRRKEGLTNSVIY